MKQVKILFFATLRDLTGEKSITRIVEDGLAISGLKAQLVEDYPELNQIMNSVIVSMNHEFAYNDAIISTDAEIALFPPVSGGCSKNEQTDNLQNN